MSDQMPGVVQKGDAIEARDAGGSWRGGIAMTDIEGTHMQTPNGYRKVHDFPVIWVRLFGGNEPIPWPAEDVRKVER